MSRESRELARAARAARAGRAFLASIPPPAVAAWIARLAAKAGNLNPPKSADEVFALAGGLAGIDAALREAYAVSGSRVRDLIWRLHAALRPETASAQNKPKTENEEIDAAAERAWAALEPSVAWLGARARGDSDVAPEDARDEARRWRAVLMQWIDAANERLTQTHYHRPEQRAAHARALIQGPMSLIAPALAGPDARWAEILLRAWDLTQAAPQAERGVNRVAPPGAGFGGFYGMTESRGAPTHEQLAAALAELRAELDDPAPGETLPARLLPLWNAWRAEMRAAVAARLAEGQWPARAAAPARESFAQGLIRRLHRWF